MKIVASLLFVLLVSGLALSCSRKSTPHETAEKTLYTCGMHPQVIQDKPGDCPICGMKLTPIRKQPGTATPGKQKIKYYKSTMNAGEISQNPGKDSMGMEMVPVLDTEGPANENTISIDPVTIQNMGIRTGLVTRGPLRRIIRTVGVVDHNESAQAEVTTKFKGWIEKLHVNSTGQHVHKGDTLFDIYSPELWSAQTEYLLSRSQPGLRNSAITKLKFFDLTDEQIAELERTGKQQKTIAIKSPITGNVMEKMAVEGQMVEAGKPLYELADHSVLWVHSQVYEQDLAYIKLGQEAIVSLSSLPESKFRGRVTFIYPTVDEKTRTAKIRMEFHNPGFFLKPGMFATVEIRAEIEPSALLVPDTAVLRSGEKNTVFVALDGGRFDPRTVVLGPRSENNMYQVRSGVSEGERLVTSGQFMLDSESQLREAVQKMAEPGAVESAQPANKETSHAPAGGGELSYVCPMPEHVSILHNAPGKCPICGMGLVPVTAEMLAKIQPAGILDYYTCPMPEHAEVHSDKPGTCPRCGMTLVPVMKEPPLPGQPDETSGTHTMH